MARRKLIPDEPKKAPPAEVDLREDDLEFDPAAVDAVTPKSSKAWLNLLRESEDAFEEYNTRCDNIDKQYANLARLADMVRDKEFQMFWSNCEVLKPSIYAKPPQPVVVPKFKDRRPVYQAASEVAERCAIVAFDLSDMDGAMKLCRDDLALIDRGVAWVRYEKGGKGTFYSHEKICVDYKMRRDFLHSISRNWREVGWVAAASYLTRGEMRKRFNKHSGNAYQTAEYKANREANEVGGADMRERAKVWEIWSKDDGRVYWVSEGCEVILDENDPHLEFRNFFPCPQPAYGTVQRGSLVPVPDVLQYRDQLEELNLLTGRIHALSDALEAKGFYPAGGAELADAIQAAVETKTPGRMLVPISNWAAFGGSKEIIVWLPIDMISQTVIALVQLRKQVIEDIYQIMGISDIMRGSTDPSETLGAQQLKTQNGSTRIRDKQQELVRMSRDMVEIFLEIICQVFDPVTIIEMSQTQLPTEEMKEQQIEQLVQQAKMLQAQMQQAAPPPSAPPANGTPSVPGPSAPSQPNEQVQGQLQQLMRQYRKIQEQPTIDQVLHFLSDNRARAFTLDIETDSTILADEQAEKQMTNEFMGVLATVIPQLTQMIQLRPQAAEFAGELLKFATKPYRAGRALDGAIDSMIEQLKAEADQPQADDPETAKNKLALQIEGMKQQTEAAKLKQQAELEAAKMAQADKHKTWELNNQKEIERMKLVKGQQTEQAKVAVQNQKAATDREAHQAHMIEKAQDIQLKREEHAMTSQMKQNDMAARSAERQQAHNQRMMQASMRPPGGGQSR